MKFREVRLLKDFMGLKAGSLMFFDTESELYSRIEETSTEHTTHYVEVTFSKEFIEDNPTYFEYVPEKATTAHDITEEEYLGHFARELSVENLKKANEEYIIENMEMQNKRAILDRFEEVKATIFVLEEMLETEENAAQREAIKDTLTSLRQQYHTLTWVLNL